MQPALYAIMCIKSKYISNLRHVFADQEPSWKLLRAVRLVRPGLSLNEWGESQYFTLNGYRDGKTACI